jgi:RNA polymerase sigma factor (sigma-70 family)
MTDEQLLRAWQANDRRAGAELFNRHHRSIARFFAHKLGPDTDDLVQATFMGLVNGLEHYRGEAGFRAYLFGIARKQLLRGIHERVRARERVDPSETSLAALDPTPSEQRAIREQHKLLLAALRRLPIDTQLMLELHYWEQLAIKDIAIALDLNVNTVKTRMRRGREQLEAEMAELAESGELLASTIGDLAGWAARLRDDLRSEPDASDLP